MTSEKSFDFSLTGQAFDDVSRLAKDLNIGAIEDLVVYALRVFSDAVDAGVITSDIVKTPPEQPRDYADSWLPALRLYSAISSVAPDHSLQRIQRIIVEGRALLGGRTGIDWAKDFKQFSDFSW
jgi:hypothetical protein